MALPYVLLLRPTESETVAETLAGDMNSDDGNAVAPGAEAIRHWAHLSAVKRTPTIPSSLLTILLERVAFRRTSGAESCLQQLACLIAERPQVITPSQASLLAACLEHWHRATILPIQGRETGDFEESRRPALRALVGTLAGALRTWHRKLSPQVPEPSSIEMWRKLCFSDVLPEVRRAFEDLTQGPA